MDNREIKVWWAQCKPFSESERASEGAKLFQKECLNKNIFGMGWKYKQFNQYSGKEFDWSIANEFKTTVHSRTFSAAQNLYGKMNKGDIVLTRLDGIYYLGDILFAPRVSCHERLTWYSEVSQWKKLGKSEDLPHHVRGKISSKRYQGTVAEIDGLSALTLISFAGIKCPKQKNNKDNFLDSISDEDLEDLMAHYMSNEKEGYVFLPSSCKKNTPGIEYVMYNPKNNNTIACQTKVNRRIDVGQYSNNPTYKKYEIIYLFSGAGYDNNDYTKKNICIVERKKLYEILKSNKHFANIVCKYFDFE